MARKGDPNYEVVLAQNRAYRSTATPGPRDGDLMRLARIVQGLVCWALVVATMWVMFDPHIEWSLFVTISRFVPWPLAPPLALLMLFALREAIHHIEQRSRFEVIDEG
jgi:hypothetical protein